MLTVTQAHKPKNWYKLRESLVSGERVEICDLRAE